MAAANGTSVFFGTLAGLVGAGGLFYTITVNQLFGGTTPIDQTQAWFVKTEDMMTEGKWPREAAGPVHVNPIHYRVSGAEFARNCLRGGSDGDEDDE